MSIDQQSLNKNREESKSTVVGQATGKALVEPKFLVRVDHVLSGIAEHLNPILIKETRQALKSRQFVITFVLLLTCGWAWTMLGTIANMPAIYYSPTGDIMLAGYYCVLAIPMLIIVPFSAFRSLAAEREDGTYELLSITTLTSRQMVTGKLSSAIVQMVVYYSALAPCIVFTYILRGVDIISILALLFYTFLASVLFSAIGVMFAGLSTSRNWQTLLTVILLVALVFATFGWLALFIEILDFEGLDRLVPYEEPMFWVGNVAFLNLYVSYFLIIIFIAAAQNSFASDNRSTKIRIAMLAQTVCYIGWMAWIWTQAAEWEVLIVGLFFAAAHWYVYACFLTGESGRLSPRVKRSLPQSFFGRVFLTWLNPGSGTAYMLAVCNIGVLCLFVLFAMAVQEMFGVPISRWNPNRGPTSEAFLAVVMVFEYAVLYLGIGRIFILLVPHRERYGFVLTFIVHVFVVISACLIPIAIHSLTDMFFDLDYNRLHFSNWAWTLEQVLERRMPYADLPWVVGTAAVSVFLVNLVLTAREIETVRLETPQRVQQDMQELELAK